MQEQRSVGREIAALTNSIKRKMAGCAQWSEIPLTGMQVWVLGYIASLYGERDVFQRDIESAFNISRATASGILQRMERDGLIRRETAKIDGRQKRLILTPQALHLCQVLSCQVSALDAEMTAGIDTASLETFYQVLAKIKANLNT